MADNVIKMQEEFIKKAEELSEKQASANKARFDHLLNTLEHMNPENEEFSPIHALLGLDDEDFDIFSETFLDQYEKTMRNPNESLTMVQALNMQGIKIEEMVAGFQEVITQLETTSIPGMSPKKVEFLKRIFIIMINAISEAEGVGKKIIQIPIELCNEDAKIPAYAKSGDAGMDIYAIEDIEIKPGETVLVPTGIKVAIPYGYELQVRPKSGRALKTKLRVANTPGTIDSGYRDEVKVIIENVEPAIANITYEFDDNGRPIITSILHGKTEYIHKGEKFAQLVLNEIPIANFIETTNIGEIEGNRGGGFGSTGLK